MLSHWGDRAGDVHFVLRRTGASTSMSESGDDKVIMPERKTHRLVLNVILTADLPVFHKMFIFLRIVLFHDKVLVT